MSEGLLAFGLFIGIAQAAFFAVLVWKFWALCDRVHEIHQKLGLD